MLTKEQLNQFAEKVGFGGDQRNTYRVKLELFAKMIESAVMDQNAKLCEELTRKATRREMEQGLLIGAAFIRKEQQ